MFSIQDGIIVVQLPVKQTQVALIVGRDARTIKNIKKECCLRVM